MGLIVMLGNGRSGTVGSKFELDRKLWLARDPKTREVLEEVVEDGDPRAGMLLGSKGAKIDMALAERLGLTSPPEEELPEFYEDMKVDQLKAILAERDLPVSGTKDELIARLVTDDEAEAKSSGDGEE